MKVTLNKQVITLAELDEAKALQAEYKGYDNDMYESLVANAIRANSEKIVENCENYASMRRIIELSSVEICKDKYKLTAWITAICEVDYNTIVRISFNGCEANCYCSDDNSRVSAFVEVFRCK